jgi:hypothetical protein
MPHPLLYSKIAKDLPAIHYSNLEIASDAHLVRHRDSSDAISTNQVHLDSFFSKTFMSNYFSS